MRCKGNVEIITCKDEVVEYLNKGYSMKMVYKKLCEKGKISIDYTFFTILLKRYNIKKPGIPSFSDMRRDYEVSDFIKSKRKHIDKYIFDKNMKREKIDIPSKQEDIFGIIKKSEDELF